MRIVLLATSSLVLQTHGFISPHHGFSTTSSSSLLMPRQFSLNTNHASIVAAAAEVSTKTTTTLYAQKMTPTRKTRREDSFDREAEEEGEGECSFVFLFMY